MFRKHLRFIRRILFLGVLVGFLLLTVGSLGEVTATDDMVGAGSSVPTAPMSTVGSLSVEIIDAYPLAMSLTNGALTGENGPLSEEYLRNAGSERELIKRGLVADGNARLLLVARTSIESGMVRFTSRWKNLSETWYLI